MNKISRFFFSFPLMGLILFVFAAAIAVATFIERDFGTDTARAIIYNAKWFEALLLLGVINISGIILTQKLYRREKFSLFIFHVAFILILIGSAVTRYFGFEGVIHIREGETSDKVISEASYLYASAESNGNKSESSKEVRISALSKNYHKLEMKCDNKPIKIECTEIIHNAIEVATEVPNGEPVLELVFGSMMGRQDVILGNGKTKDVGMFKVSLNDSSNIFGVNFISGDSGLFIKSPFQIVAGEMTSKKRDTLISNEPTPFDMKKIYEIHGMQFMVTKFYPSALIDVMSVPHESKMQLPDVLRLNVNVGEQSKKLLYYANKEALNHTLSLKLNNVDIQIGYGSKTMNLPFSLKLDTFKLSRYPGSNSPSGYESKITLIDGKKGIQEQRRIFMNNVLKYSGYRFYQSSYDDDEKGTILSVNKDYWGTLITYTGYILMSLGMFLSLFNKNSRFFKLNTLSNELKEKKKTLKSGIVAAIILMASFTSINAQSIPESIIIPKDQADKFGKVLIQDMGGRIKPINSLSSELIRKITRKTSFAGQNYDQVFLGMLVFPDFWQKVPMIKSSHPQITELFRSNSDIISYKEYIDSVSSPSSMLRNNVETAMNKSPRERSKFENELIRFNERANLCYYIYSWDIIRIYPKPNDKTNTWYNPESGQGHFSGKDEIFVNGSLQLYFSTIQNALKTGKWDEANMIVESFTKFQQKTGSSIIPSDSKVKAELLYNKLDIFQHLSSIYGLVGFILLIFLFISVFKPNLNIKYVTGISFIIILICFGLHTLGLGLRWYISEHAPWSNGYESMIYIGWATILAGVLFKRKSNMAFAVSALLTWNILFVAHLSWMDPEVTNLVPVLKSYWLVIHVAVITASYSFLAIGALLAFLNLVYMFLQNKQNYHFTGLIISELTVVIEMALIVGLYLLTIGTFLGGVWANESWGRYWGWDAKETWALVTVLVYGLLTHLRLIPGFKGKLLFNILALLSFSTVIMTYFGVNYYLGGMHSYAKGESVPVPAFVYYTIAIVSVVIFLAVVNQKMVLRDNKPNE